MTPVTSGVPQGSVIGPLLYSVFTNEISEAVKSRECLKEVHLERSRLFSRQCSDCGILSTYADDTTYVVSSDKRERNQEKITTNLENLRKYLNDNKLAINLSKTATTEFMVQQMKGKTPGNPPSLLVESATGVQKWIQKLRIQ